MKQNKVTEVKKNKEDVAMREVTNIMGLRITIITKGEKKIDTIRKTVVNKLKKDASADDVTISNCKMFLHEEEKKTTYILDLKVTYIVKTDDPVVYEAEDTEEIRREMAKKIKKFIGADDVVVMNRKVFVMDK